MDIVLILVKWQRECEQYVYDHELQNTENVSKSTVRIQSRTPYI